MIGQGLPPLNALRSFEATARHLSLKGAAEELNVTPPAVSHQIKALELHLGFTLFQRLRRGLRLTPKGEAYFHRITNSLEAIATATKDIRESGVPTTFTIAVPPHFLTSWMLPRLSSFVAKYSVLDLRVIDTIRKVDFESENVDAQILYGEGNWTGVDLDLLVRDELCLVCSPGFLAGFGPVTNISELVKCPLIYTERRNADWYRIFNATGVDRALNAPRFTTLRPLPAIEAAVQGIGVAITSRFCVSDSLTTGKLVVPFDLPELNSNMFSYFLSRRLNSHRDKRLKYLNSWLTEQITVTLEQMKYPGTGKACPDRTDLTHPVTPIANPR
ncbi:MAG: LysR family transcriptional regulator [Rhodobacteraceae bacterium]|nr:LysR family transcriptional regulator [Paracoccaceae bacterium]